MLSLIVPCYNEEGNVKKFFDETNKAFEGTVADYEFVFVNDGSRDSTYQKLKEIYESSSDNVQVLSFSRNFGKESAIYAGLSHAKGDRVCLIDADLQQRPEVVLEMLEVMKANPTLDCVTAYQEKRKEGGLISAVKSLFYKIINKMSDVPFVNGASDFRLLNRNMVEALLQMSEYHRFSKGLFSYVGFNTAYIPYQVAERESGESKWGVKKLFKYAIEGIMSFSTAPLKIPTYLGALSILSSIIYFAVSLIRHIAFSAWLTGTTAIITLLLFLSGIHLLCLGILGEYIAKLHVQSKNRPIFILKDHLKKDK